MPEITFEDLVKENEKDLQRIRNTYFPLIRRGIITGYNLSPQPFDYTEGSLFLNYFHSDLRIEDKHFHELHAALKRELGLNLEEKIDKEAVNKLEIFQREADYISRPEWVATKRSRIFDLEGNELSASKASSLKRIIEEGIQYDMLLRMKSKKELTEVVEFFKKYVSKYALNKKGRMKQKKSTLILNNDAIPGSWEIPLILCTNKRKIKPRGLQGFLTVYEFSFIEKLGSTTVLWTALVRSQAKELYRHLEKNQIKVKIEKKYALRAFVEDYLEKE